MKEYAKAKGYTTEEWGVLSDLVKDGLISQRQARDFLIRKHYIEKHQEVGCMKIRRRLAKDFGISTRMVQIITS